MGEHGSEQNFTGHALPTLEFHVWQLLGVAVIDVWQLELETVKHCIIYSFVLPCPNCCSVSCSSLALKPVWRAVCSKSFPGDLLGAFVSAVLCSRAWLEVPSFFLSYSSPLQKQRAAMKIILIFLCHSPVV